MQALLDAVADGRLQADVRLVLSNRADALGLERAKASGIETVVLSHRDFSTREAYDAALAAELLARRVDFVCLAGFMRRLGTAFCAAFPNRVFNVHPSLLPAFPGVDAQAQALAHGVKVAGATVHLVTPELDAGPILAQESVAVLDDDTVETLASRILLAEHRIYPLAVQRVVAGGWRLDGRRVVFSK